MGLLALKQSGIIYQEGFGTVSLDSRWESVPSDAARVSLVDVVGSVVLKHGSNPIYLFFEPLTEIEQFVMDVENVFNPTTTGDVGGLVVFGSTTNYLALEEYYDVGEGTTLSYPWIRLIRDYNMYYAYWSVDGLNWNILGSQSFDNENPKVGLFLKGTTGSDLEIKSVNIFRGASVSVGNLLMGTKVELLDSVGVVLQTKLVRTTDAQTKFDLSGIAKPFTGSFRITTTDSAVYESGVIAEIWGGDSFMFEPNVDLYYVDAHGVDQLLSENMEAFLGYLNSGDLTYKDYLIKAKNSLAGTLSDITISLIQYHDTDQYTRYPHLAPDISGVPGTFGNSVGIATINAGTTKNFWLRLDRETDPLLYTDTNVVYFGFNVVSNYTVE